MSRNEWISLLHKQLLCLHQGKIRVEIAGDQPEEEEQEEEAEHEGQDKKGGFYIKLADFNDQPKISVRRG